jgi:hypothetical protein
MTSEPNPQQIEERLYDATRRFANARTEWVAAHAELALALRDAAELLEANPITGIRPTVPESFRRLATRLEEASAPERDQMLELEAIMDGLTRDFRHRRGDTAD